MTPQVIGIDLSLTSPAFATEAGEFTRKPKMTGPQRLYDIREWVLDGIEYDPGRALLPAVAVIEGYGQGHGGNITLGELGGVVRLALWEAEVPYVDIPPARLKAFARRVFGGKGTMSKTDMVVAAREKLGYRGTSDDEADALWLRQMGLVAYGLVTANAEARKVVDAVTWPALPADTEGVA